MSAAWRQAIDTLRRPLPSPFRQAREVAERVREAADLEVPGRLEHARAPARWAPGGATGSWGGEVPAAAPSAPRGRPPIHDWPRIKRLDAEFCRTYFANNNRAPIWKERWKALEKKLGSTPRTARR